MEIRIMESEQKRIRFFVRNDFRTHEYIIIEQYKSGMVSLAVQTGHKSLVLPILKGITENTNYENLLVIQGKKAWDNVFLFIEGNLPNGYKEVTEDEF
jgi:hypothetical protein